MYNKRAILIVALLFLAVVLIFGLSARSDVAFAKSSGVTKPMECKFLGDTNPEMMRCCSTYPDSKGIETEYCTESPTGRAD
jgi:hypothetical protein